jgi:hypothetical protein
MKRLIVSSLVASIVAMTLFLVALEAHHHSKYGHFFPLGLHADVNDFQSDIGSGSATFFHGARLTNYGLYPQEVERCEFISDANAYGVSLPYRVEKFDYSAHHWKTLFDNKQNFCPQAKLVRKALWTGQTLSTGEEATAYRVIPNGDTMRFVIEDNGREFPTMRFSVTEVYSH